MSNQEEQVKMHCQQYINHPVKMQVNGQEDYSGIIEYVDDDHVYLIVPIDENGGYLDLEQLLASGGNQPQDQSMMRQGTNERYPYYNPYYQPYPYYPNYYYPRPYGWNRLILPLAALTALSIII